MENTSEGLRIYERYSIPNNSRVSEIKWKFITILNVVYLFHRKITVFFNIIPDHTNAFATFFYGFKISRRCVEYTKMGL